MGYDEPTLEVNGDHETGKYITIVTIKRKYSDEVVLKGVGVSVSLTCSKGVDKHPNELDFYTKYSHDRIVPLLGYLRKDDEEFLAYKYL